MNNNKKNGNKFEQDLCDYLAKRGFWAHNLAANQNGQPFDIICSRNNYPRVIDCKECENNVFQLSRVEENQELAMRRWQRTGNIAAYFALKLADGRVYMLSFNYIMSCIGQGMKSLGIVAIQRGTPLEEWAG